MIQKILQAMGREECDVSFARHISFLIELRRPAQHRMRMPEDLAYMRIFVVAIFHSTTCE